MKLKTQFVVATDGERFYALDLANISVHPSGDAATVTIVHNGHKFNRVNGVALDMQEDADDEADDRAAAPKPKKEASSGGGK